MTAQVELYHVVDGRLTRYGREDAPEPPPPPPVLERFPGDPNPKRTGRTWFGAGVGRNSPVTAKHETPTGAPLAIRRQFYADMAAITPPNGALLQAVRADHAAGRLPWVSCKVDWAQAASGALDGQFDALIAGLNSYSKPTWLITNHEPEDNVGGTNTPANFRAMQRRFRQRLNAWIAAHPGSPNRISFGGCLMSWTWNPGSGRNPEDWWPGSGTWDWVGADHYTEVNAQIDRTNPWGYFVTWINGKGVPFAIPEYGLRGEDPDGPTKMRAFYNKMTSGAYDCVAMAYFDSDANSTGTGWTLTDQNGLLAEFHRLMRDPRSLHLADLGY